MRRADLRSRGRAWLAGAVAVVAAATLAVAVTTPPRSGPFCRSGCLSYPYTGGAEYVPRDFWWMYPAVVLTVLVVPFTATFAERAASRAPVLARVAESLATLAAGLLVAAYAIQLAVVQPSLSARESDGLSWWSQYNPHGAFIAMEDAGYAVLGVLFLVLAGLVGGRTRLERTLRGLLAAGGAGILGALVGLSLRYGAGLDYRFEVVGILLSWLLLILVGSLGARLFRRESASPLGSGQGPRPRPETEPSPRRS